jgi:hypothetical protein
VIDLVRSLYPRWIGHFCIAKGVRFRGFRTLIDTGFMAPSSIGSIGAWVRLLLELNADLSTKHSISSFGALSGPVWGL